MTEMKEIGVDRINFSKLFKSVVKLTKGEKEFLIFELLRTEEVSFTTISQLYVKYLEVQKDKSLKKESLFASCLASSISGSLKEDKPFFHSQAYVLLNKWVPDNWIKKFLGKRKTKYIVHNKRLIE